MLDLPEMTISSYAANEALARMQGYTKALLCESHNAEMSISVLAKPDYDPDGPMRVWDLDEGEWLRLNAWHFDIEEL